MVSAKEVAQVAVYGGPLDKRGRTGWKKRYFYLTMSQWMYYDTNDSSAPSFITSATDISAVEELNASSDPLVSQSLSSSSQKGFIFAIVVGKKRSELRAATEEDRDGWIGALAPYTKETAPLSSPHAHHPKSRSKAELVKVAEHLKQQLAFQKKKTFVAEDAITILAKKFPHLTPLELETWGQTLLDAKLIQAMAPTTKDSIAFKRHPGVFSCEVKKSAKLSAEAIIEELKDDICANYSTFLAASSEIRSMESSVSHMKTLLTNCKRSLALLQSVTLEPPKLDGKKGSLGSMHGSSATLAIVPDDANLELEHSLEMYLFEQDYDGFAALVVDTRSASPPPHTLEVLSRYTQQFVVQVTARASVHRINRERHVGHLIRLGETKVATDMCLHEYSARIATQLRTVPASGVGLNYVLEASRAFFTTLLMCYEDFLASFEGQPSGFFVALTGWIHGQVALFAGEIALHIFECPDPAMAWVVRPPADFKAASKAIGASLRYLFFGARQLELAGLPIAASLSTCLGESLETHVRNYARAIKLKVKDEVKRERWELLAMKIRDDKSQREEDVVLSKSARYFYGLLQQYLRDLQKLLHPSYPTSHSPRIQLTVLYETELVLSQYLQDIKAAFDNPKTLTSVKYAHVVAMLATMRYIEKDSVHRVLHALRTCVPAAQIGKALFGSQVRRRLWATDAALWKVRQLWEEMFARCIPRMAQALLLNSIRWGELNLSSETLPTDGQVLFLTTFLTDLTSVSPDQLDIFGELEDVMLQLLEAVLTAMAEDATWWQLVDSKQKVLGYGGTSQFIAELRVMIARVASPRVERSGLAVEQRLVAMYSRVGTKKELAPDAWYSQYAAEITREK
ncbi:hypothetical protein ACHHYP_09114 [Achlya hypogyna]|uniref:Exocyst complex component 8 n=1 Tax=Achlya hypogyna TaxID=1202772 RepID=A0A1V9YNN3_ACHHY|nr:hypothetical protein ACHHYP_09114 [Achlya hypogyna]